MKRIAVIQFYFYPDISAVSQLLGDLLCGLAESSDYEITVYCATSSYAPIADAEDPRYGRLRIVRIRTPNVGRLNLVARVLEYLGFYVSVFFRVFFQRGLQAVVCLSSPPLIALPVSLAVLPRRLRLVYYIEDLFPEILFDLQYLKRPWLIRRLQSANRLVMRRADSIVTLGSYMTRKVVAGYPEAAGKTIEIPNWALGSGEQPKPTGSEFTLLYSGNMGVAHDFSLLKPLLRELGSSAGLRYRFIGGGARFQEVREIFREAGEGRVELGEYTSRMEHEANLAAADIFLISQRRESVGDLLPSKLYSYLAAGRPMLFLGPRDSEIGRIIGDNEFGVVVEYPEDVLTARQYIEFLRADPGRSEGIGERMRSYYRRHFGVNQALPLFRQALETLSQVAG